ncbi:hypothetical protein TNCT_300491 [Trichonephila clavata]|uniref:Uncharacterized protein n=1 Tax=Trichonephila clavata TaxID=2740835 RepID=A0A8X6EYQ3_TRICU|nr:hypothetical protein TNCT_300491 [Trichonephila clavata]
MKTNTEEFRYRFKNPDNSSVFRSGLVPIREALSLALDNRASDTSILNDSKSSSQFLKDWSNILDMLGQDILSKLAAMTQANENNGTPVPAELFFRSERREKESKNEINGSR